MTKQFSIVGVIWVICNRCFGGQFIFQTMIISSFFLFPFQLEEGIQSIRILVNVIKRRNFLFWT